MIGDFTVVRAFAGMTARRLQAAKRVLLYIRTPTRHNARKAPLCSGILAGADRRVMP